MATDPKPISITQIATDDYEGNETPQPFAVIGGIGPFSQADAVANITADPGALADLAAARTALTATNNKLNAVLAELRQAGVIAS